MKKQKVALVGGGSGGHITPLFAIAEELDKLDDSIEIIYITERGGKFNSVFDGVDGKVKKVFAGKFRRYHGVSKTSQILDVKTVVLNIIDIFKIIIGFFESLIILTFDRPNVVFAKGGYVSLPVGMATRLLRIKYITHDSDRSPSLTNKLIGKGATWNLLGFEQSNSLYDHKKTKVVGIPVSNKFSPLNVSQKKSLRSSLNIPEGSFVILVIGGSIGADRLNNAVSKAVEGLLDTDKGLYIIHQVGAGQKNYYKNNYDPRLRVINYIDDVSVYSGSADLIISRAGATAIAEFATQNKPIILVPNPNLTGGHQVENAQLLADSKACILIKESKQLDEEIKRAIIDLSNNRSKLDELSKNINKFSSYESASNVADIIAKECNLV